MLTAIGYEAWLYDHEETRAADSKWGNVREFSQWLAGKGEKDEKTLIDLTQTIALINMLDKQNEDSEFDAVQLSTLHAAKGLEYKNVFLVGVEEGILPHSSSVESGTVEEERRLMYVGITRARQHLHLSWCEKRKQGKEMYPCEPSRFIAEMGNDLRISGGKAAAEPDKATSKARFANLRNMLGSGES